MWSLPVETWKFAIHHVIVVINNLLNTTSRPCYKMPDLCLLICIENPMFVWTPLCFRSTSTTSRSHLCYRTEVYLNLLKHSVSEFMTFYQFMFRCYLEYTNWQCDILPVYVQMLPGVHKLAVLHSLKSIITLLQDFQYLCLQRKQSTITKSNEIIL